MTDWQPDALLPGYESCPLVLPEPVRADGEPDDAEIQGTLIRQHPPKHRRAVMYLHGWSDYFFQTHLADFFDDLGFDFHAVELRRYGRSLRDGQLGGYTTDLHEYFDELDEALRIISVDHDDVTLMAHSTGGLIGSLWAHARPGLLNGVLLNSPWLDLQGSNLVKTLTSSVTATLAGRYPTAVLPLPDSGIYARSIHVDGDGEWDFDLGLKQHPSFLIRAGWLRAIVQGHAEVSKGLEIPTPVLCLLSQKTHFRRSWDEAALTSDTVLDVEKLAKQAVKLGPHVTVVRIKDGLHDLVLSGEQARTDLFDQMTRWLKGYIL